MKTLKKLQSGLTLVEVLASAVILGICFAGLLTALTVGIRSIHNAKNHLQVINIIKQKAEELKLLGYNGIIDNDGNILIDTGDPNPIIVTIDNGGTPSEDFNFNGVLDTELDENDNPISGTGEDIIEENGVLDINTNDDILGELTITIGNKINLENSTSNYDDALPITVTVTWQKIIGGGEVSETIQVLIPKEGVT